jgi:type IX secretion system substrate protein
LIVGGILNKPVSELLRQNLIIQYPSKPDCMKSFLKTLCLSGCLTIFVSLSSKAQCTNSLQSITYDTLIAGTGNNTHSFTFSQFDPSIGTLVSAKVNAVVSVNYGFTLQNVETVQRDFSVAVGRYDYFSSTAMVTPYSKLLNLPLGSFLLDPGNTVTQPSSTILYRYMHSDSITENTANFLGYGSVNFNYTPITYTNLTGSNVYYYSATASDTIHFSITYYYCNTTILPVSIIDFLASKDDSGKIELSWITLNEDRGCQYEIQKSEDGYQFMPLTSMLVSTDIKTKSDYLYDYNIAAGDGSAVYFRIKLTDASGNIKYSETRKVVLNDNSTPIYIYPNPSNSFINVAFNQATAGSWQVDIYASNGSKVQSNYFVNSNNIHIAFKQKLAAGIYFIHAANPQMQNNYVQPFCVK